MNRHIKLTTVTLLVFGLGMVFGQRRPDKGDKKDLLGTDYQITGYVEPLEGQTFPSSWGRLVNYAGVGDQHGTIREQRFVFEAQDGTIRIVKTDLNWNRDVIDDAEVITIGRN